MTDRRRDEGGVNIGSLRHAVAFDGNVGGRRVAKEATSSLSAMGQMTIAPDTGALRRSAGLGAPDTGPAYITAEIPAVSPVGPSYGVLLPDGSVWYPGSRKRLPAPLLLRIVVWVLAFATLLAGIGDFIVRYHPSWLSAIRRTAPTQTAHQPKTNAPAGGVRPASSSSTHSSTSAVTKVSPQPSLPPETTAFWVAAPRYSVVVTAGSQSVWVFAQSVKNGVPVANGAVFEDKTVPAHSSYFIAPTSGDLTVEVAAGGATISVFDGHTKLGTVTSPPPPWHYWFVGVRRR
jgi:hypothetical protein